MAGLAGEKPDGSVERLFESQATAGGPDRLDVPDLGLDSYDVAQCVCPP